MRCVLKYLLCALMLCCGANISAQTIDELQKQYEKNEAEIKAINALIQKTSTNRKARETELKLIQTRKRERTKNVGVIEQKIRLINDDISLAVDSITLLENNLTKLRADYGTMVYEAYKNYKLNNFMLFLFSSHDFNDATRRIAYMQQYNRMRQLKAEEIENTELLLSSKVTDMTDKKEMEEQEREVLSKELSTIAGEESQKNALIKEIQREAGKHSADLKAKQTAQTNLKKRIEKLIEEEIRKNRNEVKTDAQREVDIKLSGLFGENEGKLPYPVTGVIIDRYGRHNHPTLAGVVVNNSFIKIAADPGAQVRSVFDGEVAEVFYVQGAGNNVMVRHGNYYTVYSNLETVGVKRGAKITTNQELGRLSSSASEDSNILQFQLWQNSTNLNPEKWLRK